MANLKSRSFFLDEDSKLTYVPETSESDSGFKSYQALLGSHFANIAFKVQEALPSYRGSLSRFSNPYLCAETADYVSCDEELDRLRVASRAFYERLGALTEEDQEFGRKSWYVAQMMSPHRADPKTTINALSEVLLTNTPDISDDARVAALRYASGHSAFSSTPEMLSLCFSSLDSDVEQQAIAAAETLGDLGDRATLPQMNGALRYVKWERAKEALKESVKEIERTYGVDSNSP